MERTPKQISKILKKQSITINPIISLFFWFRKPRKAAVALCLRKKEQGLEVLFIQRAKRKNDPWSGHMAFPGGHQEKQDFSFEETAIRETQEEVGIDLRECAEYLGPLKPLKPISRRFRTRLLVYPKVFFVNSIVDFTLNYEVDQVVWVPLKELLSGKYDEPYFYEFNNMSIKLPSWKYEGYVIWGLTYKMLQSFLKLIQEE